MSTVFEQKIDATLKDPRLQKAVYSSTGRLISHRLAVVSPEALPDYQELRTHANAIKAHTIENLDWYLEEFERNVVAHGGTVHWCRTASDVADVVLEIAKRRAAKLIVKSKSMTTEEIDLNERLEHHGIQSVESDFGEYIIQLMHQRPYHIVAPALHLTRYDVADIFAKELGVENEVVIEKQTKIARNVLRRKFLDAGMGVSGANFLIAD